MSTRGLKEHVVSEDAQHDRHGVHGAVEDFVAVEELKETFTPRLGERDARHVHVLAQSYDRLPSILVHRQSMAVIDGIHRLMAAKLLGHGKIGIRLFDGSEMDAYIEAVRANGAHGKPLSLAEREHAAGKILNLCPEWSDRRIAEICGLSPKTVSSIRLRATGEILRSRGRVGRDGRRRPSDPAQLRIQVAELLRENPGASSRSVATQASASPSTVLDVRRRLERGESPLPPRLRQISASETAGSAPPTADRRTIKNDEALAATSESRAFTEWFQVHRVLREEARSYALVIPLSRVYIVADEAREQASIWQEFASLVESRSSKGCRDR